MSEKAPRSNPRLENFDAKKAEVEQQAFENALYGEAGQGDDPRNYSDESRKRIEEADEYERHMEKLANETRSDYDRGLDRLESGESESAAFNREWDDALAANEGFDADKKAKQDALNAKIAADSKLRRLDMMARDLSELKSAQVSSDKETADRQSQRLDDLEDRFVELISEYEDSAENFDADVVVELIDRTAAKAKDATPEKRASDEPAMQDAAEIVRMARENPELLKDPRVKSHIDGLIDALDSAEELNNQGAKNLEELANLDAPDVDAEKADGSALDDLKDVDAPDIDSESDKSSLDDLADLDAPDVDAEGKSKSPQEELADLDAPDIELEADVNRPWYKRAQDRMNAIFKRGFEAVLGRIYSTPEQKKHTKLVTGLGVLALAGVGIALTAKGIYDHLHDTQAAFLDSRLTDDSQQYYHSLDTGADMSSHLETLPDSAAHTITSGEGWLHQLKDMNIPEGERQAMLDKILASNDPGIKEWTYQMQNGDPGLSHPGQIPQSVLESIEKLR